MQHTQLSRRGAGSGRYKFVDFIESDGNAYTCFPLEFNDIEILLDTYISPRNSVGKFILGGRTENKTTGREIMLGTGTTDNIARIDYRGDRAQGTTSLLGQRVYYHLINGICTVECAGNTWGTTIVPYYSRTASVTCGVFTNYTNNIPGDIISNFIGRIYVLDIITDIQNYRFRPVYDKIEKDYGLMNTLTGDVLKSITDTPFTGGFDYDI